MENFQPAIFRLLSLSPIFLFTVSFITIVVCFLVSQYAFGILIRIYVQFVTYFLVYSFVKCTKYWCHKFKSLTTHLLFLG